MNEWAHAGNEQTRVQQGTSLCKTKSACEAFAKIKTAAYYGMEYPQGCPTHQAQCLFLTETQVRKWGKKTQDAECNVVKQGVKVLKQGGSYRVYVRPVSV